MWKVLAVAVLVLCTPSTATSSVKPDEVEPEPVVDPKLIPGQEGQPVPHNIAVQMLKKIWPAMPKVPLLPEKLWPAVKSITGMEVDYGYYYDYNNKKTTYTTEEQLAELSTMSFAGAVKPTWGSVLMNAATQSAILLLAAFIYKTTVVDKRKAFPGNISQNGEFKFGLFDCFSNMNLCCLACCCAPMRAADTFSLVGAMPYWNVVGIFCIVTCIITILPAVNSSQDYHGVSTLILACVFRYRHELRKKLGKQEDADMNTQAMDCLTWLCCQCCAIAQEARVVDAAAGQEPACLFCMGLKSVGPEGTPLVGNAVAAE
eukprot:TRINITY_DN4212_c0_g1_i1.p1 TRINITY_DN4212_c0_g1~~TRINITY_DN4212_c0_g1_i1.p1  ORF type:complete len:316 (+),score=50.60 TRINITY_DN4212_c0_g1_i1:142-1089(+)